MLKTMNGKVKRLTLQLSPLNIVAIGKLIFISRARCVEWLQILAELECDGSSIVCDSNIIDFT